MDAGSASRPRVWHQGVCVAAAAEMSRYDTFSHERLLKLSLQFFFFFFFFFRGSGSCFRGCVCVVERYVFVGARVCVWLVQWRLCDRSEEEKKAALR